MFPHDQINKKFNINSNKICLSVTLVAFNKVMRWYIYSSAPKTVRHSKISTRKWTHICSTHRNGDCSSLHGYSTQKFSTRIVATGSCLELGTFILRWRKVGTKKSSRRACRRCFEISKSQHMLKLSCRRKF